VKRREFISLLGGAGAWPLAACAQQRERVRRIGMLMPAYTKTDPEAQARIAAFVDTFQKLGWSEGRNVRIDYRWSGSDADRDKAAAAEFARSAPDVIVVSSNPAKLPLRQRLHATPGAGERDGYSPICGPQMISPSASIFVDFRI
jgi:putative tryptophan/tyrosine transport system substrate-binding protein